MVDINRYIDIEKQVALKGQRGYYVEPNMIIHILVTELNFGLSYIELENFWENAKVNLTEKEIEKYLREKQEIENPNLYEDYDYQKKNFEFSEDPDAYISKTHELETLIVKYHYDEYTYKYYDRMITKLKNKCMKFAILIEYLTASRGVKMNEDQLALFVHKMEQLDIDVNEFGIHYNDVLRIVEPLLYNIKELKKYVDKANKLETYEHEKKSVLLHETQKAGNLENSLYPIDEIQIQDIDYDGVLGLIPFTKRQKEKLINKKVEDFSAWLDNEPDKSKLKK